MKLQDIRSQTMWNARYSEPEFAFGTEPNDFLKSLDASLPRQGFALCLAEGQGRNAVWLAQRGLIVTAVDISDVGLRRAGELAASRGVELSTVCADLNDFEIEPGKWDLITSICCHLPSAVRRKVHRGVVAGLSADGVYVLESYTPGQIKRGTGGPKDPDLCPTADLLREELAGLEFLELRESVRLLIEGTRHTGEADLVDAVARRPAVNIDTVNIDRGIDRG